MDLAALQDAKQEGLDFRGRLADLVEEEGAARRAPEVAVLGGRGAGEGAALDAEELGGGEVRRDRRHVERHPGTVATRAVLVQSAGRQLLAGTRLAAQKHRHLARRGADDLLAQSDERRAGADQAEARKPRRRRRRVRVEEQRHTITEKEHDAARDFLRRQLAGTLRELSVDLDRHRPGIEAQPCVGKRLETPGAAAEEGVGQGTGLAAVEEKRRRKARARAVFGSGTTGSPHHWAIAL